MQINVVEIIYLATLSQELKIRDFPLVRIFIKTDTSTIFSFALIANINAPKS